MKNVEIITKEECSHCDNAKALMRSKKIEYTEYYLGLDYTREQILETYPSQKTLPIILIDNELIGGYNDLVEYLREKKKL